MIVHISAFAENVTPIARVDWGSVSKGMAFTNYLTVSAPNAYENLIGDINFSKEGVKKIYFHVNRFENYNHYDVNTNIYQVSTCEHNGIYKREIIKINDQAVKVFTFCNKYLDADIQYSSYTAETQKGQDFILNSLLNAEDLITVEIHGKVIPLSAKGFAKEWKSAGGNAL